MREYESFDVMWTTSIIMIVLALVIIITTAFKKSNAQEDCFSAFGFELKDKITLLVILGMIAALLTTCQLKKYKLDPLQRVIDASFAYYFCKEKSPQISKCEKERHYLNGTISEAKVYDMEPQKINAATESGKSYAKSAFVKAQHKMK